MGDEIRTICEACITGRCSVVSRFLGLTTEKGQCQCPCHGKIKDEKYIQEAAPHHEVGKWQQ